MVLEDKEKSYEELVSETNTKLYATNTAEGEVNVKAGTRYKYFRDPSGYSTQVREDQQNVGYQGPNKSKLCRAFPDMYAYDLPLNNASFKYLGGTKKTARIGDYKPAWAPQGFTTTDGTGGKTTSTYEPTTGATLAFGPYKAQWEIPFSFKIKHPQYLRWDNVHKRIQLTNTQPQGNGSTSGPQNFTPFLIHLINSPNGEYYNKAASPDMIGQLDNLVRVDYKIYATIDAKPSI